MKKNVIELKNVSKIYNTKNKTIVALDNVNYTFEINKFYAIMGPSGSGKSTFISILGLLENMTNGEYILNGMQISQLSEQEQAYYRMKNIGFVFQDFYLDDNMKSYENVILPMLINTTIAKKERKTRAFELLKRLNMQERMEHFPKELSGGEKQRVAIARALANDPFIILADEPTGNLDEENEKMVFGILKNLAKDGKMVIVVSHSSIIKEYADVCITLNKGKLSE